MQSLKDVRLRKELEGILELFRKNYVIVEGLHDKHAFAELGISAITYNAVMKSKIDFDKSKTAYIVMDLDDDGEEKEEKVLSFLSETHPELRTNTHLGKRFLHLLGSKHAEEIVAPCMELLEVDRRIAGMKRRENGKDVSRYSKVYG